MKSETQRAFGPHGLATDRALQAKALHEPLDGAAGNREAFSPQLPPDLPHAVDAEVLRGRSRSGASPRQTPPRRQACHTISPAVQHEWFALFLAHGAALIGAFATDHLLDRIERGDAVQTFARDRRRTALCDIEELSSQMNPAKGERDGIAGPCVIGNGLVGRVAVALHDAAR